MSMTCVKCGRTKDDANFYVTKRLDKYPTGRLNQCKGCLTLLLDNWDPNTYKWILEEVDVPYIKSIWDKILQDVMASGKKLTSVSVLGRYLREMKMLQYREYTYADSDKLNEANETKKKETMTAQGFTEEEIAAALAAAEPEKPVSFEETAQIQQAEAEKEKEQAQASADADILAHLTEEDILYLRLKWGRDYRPEEWVIMESLYHNMKASYDIQGAGHEDTLIMICKTSLKANQLIDINDVEGFQKMSKVYDSLMKSGKFTAAQNKTDKGEYVDTLGELFAMCETQGFIPRYYTEQPNDKVDETLLDTKRYLTTLVENETNLSALLEDAIKNNLKEDAAAKEAEDGDASLFDDIAQVEQDLTADTMNEFSDFLDAEQDLAAALEEEDELDGT